MVLIGVALIVRDRCDRRHDRSASSSACCSSPPAPGRHLPGAPRCEADRRSSASSARPALFGIVQGFIAASIYFSTGLVAERALGLTWAVFLAGGVLFAVIVPSYVEGASLHQERGGATVIARYAFNELVSFIAGWAICLDYLILVALCAFASTDYLGAVLERLQRRRSASS